MLIFTQHSEPVYQCYSCPEIIVLAILLHFKTATTLRNSVRVLLSRCMMLCQAAQCCTSKTTQQNEMASNKYYAELNSTVKSTGSTGGYGYCHLWVKASSLVWCLNIGFLICCCSFKSAWQDKTASRFPIRTLTAQRRDRHGSQASSKLSSPLWPRCASPGCRCVSYWFGAF